MSLVNATQTGTTGKFKILIIEDDAHIARLVQENMLKAGFSCRVEGTGRGGLLAFQQMRPHLVVLDLILPDVSGYEICARLRQVSTVPIVMMTARDGAEDQVHGFKLGADDYITKPFDPQLLMARVVAQLRRTYRYDVTEADQAESLAQSDTSQRSVPEGWLDCDTCHYMGPRDKFEDLNDQGMVVLICPHCDSRVIEGVLIA